MLAGRYLAALVALAPLAACGSLPHDGPSVKGVEAGAVPSGPYALVEVDYAVTQVIAANPPAALRPLAQASSAAPVDLIGEGDVLAVTVYQPGAGPAREGEAASDLYSWPRLTVDRNGAVPIPFAGEVKVSGLTANEASAAVRARLVGRLINPQVTVALVSNVANAVTVIGEVRNSGRYALSTQNDRLLDVLAAAGGATRPAADSVVSVVRGERQLSTTLADLLADPAENVRLAARDQVRVSYRPRKFSTFGALTRASQVAIEDEHLSLAGALSRMGGLDPAAANAGSVMVFRRERPAVARALNLAVMGEAPVPVIYRLNLRDPAGLFVANAFEIRHDDLVYVPRADAAELKTFFDLVSTISRVGYDVRITTSLD